MRTIKLTVDSENIIKEMASIIHAGDKDYYFMPYWFEKTDKPGVYIVHHLDKKLPTDLVHAIKNFRQ